MKCKCRERLDRKGNFIELPEEMEKYHDCDYVQKRSALVGIAAKLASETLLFRIPDFFNLRPKQRSDLFNKEFAREMETLVKAEGLLIPVP